MSDSTTIKRSILRYAIGATLILTISVAYSYPLSFLIPVLSLGFFAPGKSAPTFIEALVFILVVVVSTSIGNFLADFVDKPIVMILLLVIILINVFYTNNRWITPLLKTWIIIGVLALPMMELLYPDLSTGITQYLLIGAILTILMVWLVYELFPNQSKDEDEAKPEATSKVVNQSERLRSAILSTVVIMPVFIFFYTYKLSGALMVLVYIGILSMEPSFAKNFKTGKAMLLGNFLGGLISIIIYNLLVFVPELTFLVLIILLTGLLLGNEFFKGKKLSPLFNMAFSTILLIIASTTAAGTETEAGQKFLARIFQITMAVSYVVIVFGVIEYWRSPGTADQKINEPNLSES